MKNRPKREATISIRIPADLRERLDRIRAAHKLSSGWVVEHCLEAELPNLEKRLAGLREQRG